LIAFEWSLGDLRRGLRLPRNPWWAWHLCAELSARGGQAVQIFLNYTRKSQNLKLLQLMSRYLHKTGLGRPG
jgi:hypothetical protein